MNFRLAKRFLITSATTLVLALGMNTVSRAQGTVHSGFDLFATVPGSGNTGTQFNEGGTMVNFSGVPIGMFDFGDGKGAVPTGATDTIIERDDTVTASSAGQTKRTAITVKALNLESVGLVNGVLQFVILDATQPTDSYMDITFTDSCGGTFSSSLDINVDILSGSSTGSLIEEVNLQLHADGTWSHHAPFGAFLIDGVNNKLDGTDTCEDFWPGPFHEDSSGAAHHDVVPVPEVDPAAAMGLLLAGTGGLLLLRRRRRA